MRRVVRKPPGPAGKGYAMTPEQLVVLCIATFAGGLAFGVTGFAFGVVASLFLHHVFPPREVVFLVVTGGAVLNIVMLPRFWKDINLRESLPFLAGATFGLPLGVLLMQNLNAVSLRLITSVLVLAYCVFALLRLRGEPLQFTRRAGYIADTAIGFAGGFIGGVSGLGPLLPSVWYGLRGKDKNQARGMTQPFGIYVQGLMAGWFLLSSRDQSVPFLALGIGLPLMLLGAAVGLRLFGIISLAMFRLFIVWLSLAGAGILLIRQIVA